ncbi:ABC transporter permease [Flavobacterium humi]|uniref:FtsX-like permease family protein n=1 Tax=Flavobacterium humi TaxID=2562683 RepID=A0A4Z0L6J8_9FLAO|nr:ABC transporter permease [Flavobacterium humi]TGD57365.1 FtsX-like permease family protein [Flavobacterium humi]
MIVYVRLLKESFSFAINALRNNKLRTLLSLLGVTIGIFSIIAVLAAVDSLDRKIKKDIGSLDNSSVFVFKYCFGPTDVPDWKMEQFPDVSYDEYKMLKNELTDVQTVCFQFYAGRENVKFESKTISSIAVIPCTYEFSDIEKLDFKEGRFFSEQESNTGANAVVIGYEIAKSLFDGLSPIGKDVRLYGQRFKVVGVLKKVGDRMISFGSNPDTTIYPTVNRIRSLFGDNAEKFTPIIIIKPAKTIDDETLKAQITQKLRNYRGIKTGQDDNFFINFLKGATEMIDQTIGFMNMIGWIIAGFSLLVGGFGIANIMFVSVKERTNLIGIQKSLGAKNKFILLQFLFEAIILSVFGGIIGIFLVWLIALLLTNALDFEFVLSFWNITLGAGLAAFIGLISGILPAISAARLDPVEAIRSGM